MDAQTKTAESKQIITEYLMSSVEFSSKDQWVEVFYEITETFENAPENVIEAFQELSEYQMWEIVRNLAVEGMRQRIDC